MKIKCIRSIAPEILLCLMTTHVWVCFTLTSDKVAHRLVILVKQCIIHIDVLHVLALEILYFSSIRFYNSMGFHLEAALRMNQIDLADSFSSNNTHLKNTIFRRR